VLLGNDDQKRRSASSQQHLDHSEMDEHRLDVRGPVSNILGAARPCPKTSSFGRDGDYNWQRFVRALPRIMTLDLQICSRARISRDARFDGKFFTGVRSTKIYCRSICPVPTVKEKNVCYFPTAAAAADAGFRPCLRCRPECSPGTPAWFGTSATVSRALRLIGESCLESGGMEDLAVRLGVGSRHLRRLFIRHLGAPPSEVAQTRRLHFAKKLIDDTRLPMTSIALASGFGCVRRFNASIRKTYNRTPTQIRRLLHQKTIQPENQYVFHLRFRPPYHWNGMLAFLKPRATPGVETVDARGYRRSISVNGCHGYFEVSRDNDERNALAVRVQTADARLLYQIIERIRGMFDLNADWAAIAQGLGTDPALKKRMDIQPGLRVPGCWNGFELSVRAILGQQITMKGATTLAGRMAQTFGERISGLDGLTHLFPTPQVLADATLTKIGLTVKRAETIRALARSVCDGKISFEQIVNTEIFVERLREIPGIGSWTAQYVAMRALGDPDALPTGDLGLLRALSLKSSRELEKRAETWRPWRSYASMYLWSVGTTRLR
jgi:AraC family transcriptional regulator, regulatory protein of adaptative response / DNA-3-methyladenine glycosylase II